MRRRIGERRVQRRVADQQPASASASSGEDLGVRHEHRTSATDVAESRVTATLRTAGSGSCVTSCTDSTAPSLPTQSDGSRT